MNRALRCAALFALAALALAALTATSVQADIVSTKHNLSASGPGTVKANGESQVCIFCHAPHNSSPRAPLWNRRDSGSTYTPYASSTAKAIAGQPTGASMTCLSCHDGTIALGELLSRAKSIAMSGGATTMPAGNSNLGTDLSDDHPVSITYNSALVSAKNGELANPSTLPAKVKLDGNGQLQCTACHDPHDNSNGKFLVMPNTASALCVSCHLKSGWSSSAHKLSNATWNGTGTNPWTHTSGTTVAANACESCHRPHSAGGRKGLLNYAAEETNCTTCHGGNVAAKNVSAEFNKLSNHPITATTGVHDMAEPAIIQARHVECADCHNPHAANGSTGVLPGSLAGVRGVSIGGTEAKPVTAEYQLCFRCHGDSNGKPPGRTARQIAQTNTRLEFDPGNPSFHPVAGMGRNTNVPTLLAPWTTTSTMKCSDCHNNNTGPGAGGTGAKGPHGSTFAPLLERQYATTDRTTESASTYALCYKCHNRATLIGGGGGFREHKKHIVDERTPCNVCHDPHGVSATQGNATNNSKLINFDTTVVTPNSAGLLKFVSTGTNRGSCYMRCHGANHNPETY
ncbi:MAG: multiheme c-type cytochrome [Proteobacteria bacterium]|nr:multiheme c-type cytochrome [Pseudomonadota bacterium]